MRHLFDFGVSQEDALSEQVILDLEPSDRLLCVASAGEVPLNLACNNNEIKIDAVDISKEQLALCKLKLLAAINIASPVNAAFLGYSKMQEPERERIFYTKLFPLLGKSDQLFWQKNLHAVKLGVINCGRFELFLKRLRIIGKTIIGNNNLQALINCSTVEEQEDLFDRKIGVRKSLRSFFRIAFHPWIYRNRGMNAQGLIHASSHTGQIFFQKFKSFCTGSRANENYLLQYFLLGTCTSTAIPEFLQPQNQAYLKENQSNISFKHLSVDQALSYSPKGTYNKIHLSNIGDWLTDERFNELIAMIRMKSSGDAKLSYRYLQKNHFENSMLQGILVDKALAHDIEKQDRFPFYSILPITIYG